MHIELSPEKLSLTITLEMITLEVSNPDQQLFNT